MTTITENACRIADAVAALPKPDPRNLIALTGPPGAGKSTVAEALCATLNARGIPAAIVPMDGFHLDNPILDSRGLLPRKGAPETFDVAGFKSLLTRLQTEPEVFVPIFDRSIEKAVAAGSVIGPDHTTLIVEGNYLLLDAPHWRDLYSYWTLSVFLSVPLAELERRHVRRWIGYGLTPDAARARALSNDLPNARRVIGERLPADLELS